MCRGLLEGSILKRAQDKGLAQLEAVDLRQWAVDKHRTTDDTPYGGGPGMVMKIEPIYRALEELRTPETRVVLMTPQGRPFQQRIAEEYREVPHIIMICGHYEGVDQRVADHLVDDELSIGDYVLTNGALAALVVTDAIVRLIPACWGMRTAPCRIPFRPACWIIRIILDQRSLMAGAFRMCSCRAITRPSRNGGGSGPWI